MSDWISIVYLVAFIAFFIWMMRGTKKISRYDDPEYQRRLDEYQRRTVEAAEKQAQALADIARLQ
jgi:anaerobic C4-dicarboxylate transporter